VKRTVAVTLTLALCAALPCLLAGCSGTGAPAVPGSVTELQALATDHLTCLFLVKTWFSILHHPPRPAKPPPGPCTPGTIVLPPEPGDPPGTTRRQRTDAGCTVLVSVLFPDGSGQVTVTRPPGRVTHTTFEAAYTEGEWMKQELVQRFWDGTEMTYQIGLRLASPDNEQYWEGDLALQDGRAMQFRIDRQLYLDEVRVDLPDHSHLEVSAPVTPAGDPAWPVFTEPATGRFVGPDGDEQTFRLWSTGPEKWQQWAITAAEGVTGHFTLGDGLSGSGQIRQAGTLLGTLAWDAAGEGLLTPTQAAALPVSPSGAARDFAIDRWIGSLAELGPSPRY